MPVHEARSRVQRPQFVARRAARGRCDPRQPCHLSRVGGCRKHPPRSKLVPQSWRCRLVVFGLEVGGRWDSEAATFVRLLAPARAAGVPAALPAVPMASSPSLRRARLRLSARAPSGRPLQRGRAICPAGLGLTVAAADADRREDKKTTPSAPPTEQRNGPIPEAPQLPMLPDLPVRDPRTRCSRAVERGNSTVPLSPCPLPGQHNFCVGGPLVSLQPGRTVLACAATAACITQCCSHPPHHCSHGRRAIHHKAGCRPRARRTWHSHPRRPAAGPYRHGRRGSPDMVRVLPPRPPRAQIGGAPMPKGHPERPAARQHAAAATARAAR